MVKSRALEIQYEVTRYPGGGQDIQTDNMTRDQLRAFDVTTCDHLVNTPAGVMAYRASDGTWVERAIQGSGLGKVCLGIIQVIQWSPGVFVDPGEIAYLTSNENLCDNNTLAARISAIRRAHGETPDAPRFFVTKRHGGYALMWPAELSWTLVERIKQDITRLAG